MNKQRESPFYLVFRLHTVHGQLEVQTEKKSVYINPIDFGRVQPHNFISASWLIITIVVMVIVITTIIITTCDSLAAWPRSRCSSRSNCSHWRR